MYCNRLLFLLFTLLAAINVNPAIAADPADGKTAGFLFAYHPNPGQTGEFNAGYRKHLQWHHEHEDPLAWYGWYVGTGEKTGMFVDGTFGLAFSDFDQRVKPAEDAADFARTVAPYGSTAYRKILLLRPELSSAFLLEDRKPSAQMEVLTVTLQPGSAHAFEKSLRLLAAAARNAGQPPRFTAYRQLSGGSDPSFLLLMPRADYGELATENRNGYGQASIESIALRLLADRPLDDFLKGYSESVRKVQAETWHYRESLSNVPLDGG